MLAKCAKLVDTFDPKKTTVDAYMEDADALKDKRLGEAEKKFIHQVFYGCVRYQKFLKLFVTSFLYKCPALALRTEQTLYTILAYLMFFRLDELGVAEFRELLNCGAGTMSSLLAMLQYALSVEELEKWVKVEWCKIYDVDYVEQDIIGKLQSYSEELRPVVEEVEFKATGTVKDGDTSNLPEKRKQTEAKPFNLTKPKPRLIPEPEVISRQIRALPVPSMIHNTSLAAVEEEKKKRFEEEKARVAAKYPASCAPNLESANRRDGGELEELAKKVDAERMAECTFKPKKAKPYVPPQEEAVVRQNVAAVLREDALLKQKQAKEFELLKRYEEDLHDASEFHRWQQEMKEKDHLDEERRVHQRIVEMQLAREGAIEAYESEVRKRHILADHHKEQLQIELEQKAKDQIVELQGKQQLVKDTIEEREGARIAEAEVLKVKAERAEQLRKEKEVEFEKKRREDEFEMEKRKDLIRQIRALEKAPVERFKAYDRAEAPCQGLLEEMSYAELQERLKIIEARHNQELEDKKQRQLEKKLEKQQELAEKAETLAKLRGMAKAEAQQRHENFKVNKQEEETRIQQQREKCTMEVAAKIQQKKKQRKDEELRLKKELREISAKRQFLAADAAMVEARAHGEQHKGLDREARDRQKITLKEQHLRNDIQTKDVMQRRENRLQDQEDYKKMQTAVNERVLRAKSADRTLKEEIAKAASSARLHQKTLEKRNVEDFGHSSNRYIQRVAKMSTSV